MKNPRAKYREEMEKNLGKIAELQARKKNGWMRRRNGIVSFWKRQRTKRSV